MAEYSLDFHPDWAEYLSRLDNSVQIQVMKKVLQLQAPIIGRHLRHGLDFFVEEVGGYRITYKSDKNRKVRTLFFVGSHKDYDKWCNHKL